MSQSNPFDLHVLDQIEAYLSDGLSPEERIAFEAHAASCQTCAAALAEARQADSALRGMFADARPAAGFEDRIIRNLRLAGAPRRRLIHPMVFRSAAAVAAAVLLTSAGFVVSNMAEEGRTGIAWVDARNPFAQHARDAVYAEAPEFELSAGTELRGRSEGKPEVEQLRRNVDQAVKENKFGEAVEANRKLLEAEPSNVDAYYRVPAIQEKAKLGLAYGMNGQQGQGGGKAADQPVSADRQDALKDSIESRRSGGAANTWAFRPGDQLVQLNKKEAGKPSQLGAYDNVDNILRPLDDTQAPAGPRGEQELGRGVTIANSLGNDGTAPADERDVKRLTDNAPAPAQKVDQQQVPPPAPPPNPAQANPPANSGRKVIRNGTMEFEVASFDDALMRVSKLVADQGGFVATTDSEKLPNGKVKGTVTLRIPPERLDTLVLTLRGIGDLKSQKITAEDVTKHYTDIESELRAARAMEDRLIEIVKTGKGQIKDLLEAEKQLGVWREKIEQIEGEKRYLDNLIGLSTLALTLYERDIKTPASLQETEQVTMALETDKVDEAYEKARAAITEAKGRIIQSELKQYDAGQFGATIQAALPPEAAEQAIARVRQLPGRVAHFTRDHRQTTPNGAASAAPVSEVHKEDVVLTMQIYNLANIAPRRITSMQIAASSVEQAYHQLIDKIGAAGGRIITSSLTKPDPNQQSADLDVQVPSDKADAISDALRGAGELMRQESTENPDTANVTEAKRGYHIRIVSLATVPARESQKIDLAAASVPDAFNAISDAVRAAQGRVLQSNVDEQDRNNVTGTISFEVMRPNAVPVLAAIGKSAQVLTRTVTRSSDTENTVDTKLHLTLTLRGGDSLPPRQMIASRYEVSDVERAVDDLVNAATGAGGRRVGNGEMSTDRAGHTTAQVVVDVPLSKVGSILDQLERSGYRRSKQVSYDNTVPDGPLTRARIDATFSNSAASLGGEESTWDSIRHGLAVSGKGLRWSLSMLVIGLLFVAPWALALWFVWRLVRWSRRRQSTNASPAVT